MRLPNNTDVLSFRDVLPVLLQLLCSVDKDIFWILFYLYFDMNGRYLADPELEEALYGDEDFLHSDLKKIIDSDLQSSDEESEVDQGEQSGHFLQETENKSSSNIPVN